MNKKIIRKQLNSTLKQFEPLLKISLPPNGWIRAIRDALGMSSRQLSERMGVTQQAVSRIEKDEIHGAVTMKTMRRVAEQLDCVFIYGFVPKSGLEETVTKQAALVIKERMNRAGHSMALENQSLDKLQYQQAMDELVEELVSSSAKKLWDYK